MKRHSGGAALQERGWASCPAISFGEADGVSQDGSIVVGGSATANG